MKHNSTNSLINSLITARKGKGLSQTEMARRLNLPQSYISRLESGNLDLRLSSLVDIARYLDLEVSLLPQAMSPTIKMLTKTQDMAMSDKPLYTLDNLEDD